MKQLKQFLALSILPAALFTIGCASAGGTIKQTIEPAVPLNSYDSLRVNVESKVEMDEEEKNGLEIMVLKKIKTEGEWKISDNGQLLINITVTDISRVSQAARVLVGAFAGRAMTRAEVTVTDTASGKTINQFIAEGKSSGGSVMAGTTDESIDELAKQIVKALDKK